LIIHSKFRLSGQDSFFWSPGKILDTPGSAHKMTPDDLALEIWRFSPMRFTLLFLLFVLLAATWFGGCARQGDVVYQLHWAAETGDLCEQENASSGYQEDHLPSDIASFRIRLLTRQRQLMDEEIVLVRPNCPEDNPQCINPDGGEYLFRDLIPGSNAVIEVLGLDTGGAPIWYGLNDRVTVSPDQVNTVNIMMKRMGRIGYGFECMQVGRAWHAATTLRDGTILITGGISTIQSNFSCSGACDFLAATRSVERFDPATGRLSPVTMEPLSVPRAFHRAIRLIDGRVLIVGGSRSALFDGQRPPTNGLNFRAEPVDLQNNAEIYNPEGNGGRGTVDAVITMNEARMLFELSEIPLDDQGNKVYLISGGFNGQQKLDTAELFNFNIGNIPNFPPGAFTTIPGHMLAARAGHAAVFLNDYGRVLLIGGNDPGQPAVETFENPTDNAFQTYTLTGGELPALHYASAILLDAASSQVLIYGGSVKAQDGSFGDPNDPVHHYLLTHNPGNSTGSLATLSSTFGTAFNTLTLLASGDALGTGGGYGDYRFRLTSSAMERYVKADGVFQTVTYGGTPLAMTFERMGHTATLLPDGSVVIIGGAEKDTTSAPPIPETARKLIPTIEMYLPQQ